MGDILKLFYSILLTCLVSTLFGLLFEDKFWYIFALATIVQIVGFLVFSQIYTNRLTEKLEQIKIDQLKEVNRNLVTIGCPCDENNKQVVDFRFDQKNIYKCDSCGKNFTAMVDFKTVLTTDPIYFDN